MICVLNKIKNLCIEKVEMKFISTFLFVLNLINVVVECKVTFFEQTLLVVLTGLELYHDLII